jgi:gephyrin
MYDSPESLEFTLRDAMRRADVIVTSGGVSMGELDLLKPTIERSLGGTIHFGRVNMKPGKPTTFATVPFKDNTGGRKTRLIFALPGNPASAITTTNLFVLPAIQAYAGFVRPGLPRIKVLLEEKTTVDPARPEYVRATLSVRPDGRLSAKSTGGQRSSRVGSFKAANALLEMPADGRTSLPKETEVEALLIGPLTL